MTRPLLSVVIPTWNRAHLVAEAISSALAQSNGGIEVIVVDDGSTDDTVNMLDLRFGAQITLIRMPARSGVGPARNAGVSRATGELLSFLDSDDLWLPGKLSAELDALRRFPDAEAIVSDSKSSFNGELRERSRFMDNGALAATQGSLGWLENASWLWSLCQNGVATCSITMTRRAVEKLGEPLFAVDLTSCEDWELEVRIYQQCRVLVLPEVWSHVRCIDDGTRIGRACPGQPRSRAQDILLRRDRLTAMGRSVNVDRLAPALRAAFVESRELNSMELAQLEQIEN